MQDNQVFRLILALGMVLVMPVNLYHPLRSQRTREPLDRRQEGLFILLTLRPIGFAGIIGTLILHRQPQLDGLVVGAPADRAALGRARDRRSGRRPAHVDVPQPVHQHHRYRGYPKAPHVGDQRSVPIRPAPFLCGHGLGLLAGSLATANWFIAFTGGLAVALIAIRTSKEEELLVRRFGDDYRSYMNRTGRFIPRIG